MINILSQDEINKGINDIESFKRLNNENLIKFMHYFSDNNQTCLVFEFLQVTLHVMNFVKSYYLSFFKTFKYSI